MNQNFLDKIEKKILSAAKKLCRCGEYGYEEIPCQSHIRSAAFKFFEEQKFKRLGSGCSRTTYSHKTFKKVVFKFTTYIETNKSEYNFYKENPKKRRYLAKVYNISKLGHLLLQEKVECVGIKLKQLWNLQKKLGVYSWDLGTDSNTGINKHGNAVAYDFAIHDI